MVTKIKKFGYYLWKLLLTKKTLNLFKVLNIETRWTTIIKSQTIFNTNKAKNVVTIWIFCMFNEFNKKKEEKWSESSISRYNLIISK